MSVPMDLPDNAILFACLNRRYARSLNGRTIRYDGPAHVVIDIDDCNGATIHYGAFLYRNEHGRGLRSSKETMLIRLIHDELKKIRALWRQIIAKGPLFGLDRQYSLGILIDRLDVEMCDAFDTLMALEDAAENMGIAGYQRVLVKLFDAEPCTCSSCKPPDGLLAALWASAQKHLSDKLSPTTFERMFGALRDDVAQK